MPATILVVDDEEKLTHLVSSYLQASGYLTLRAGNGVEALRAWKEGKPDLLILDINMPELDGIAVAREIRKSSDLPIIFLSAMTEEADRIVGLEVGGDDYVSKPFSPRELVSRVRAILRRGQPLASEQGCRDAALHAPGISIDLGRRSVTVDGRARELTTIQLDILAFLMGSPGRVFTRLEILEGTAGESFDGYERTIDAHIKNIRKALGDPIDCPRFLGTVRGVGYKFICGER